MKEESVYNAPQVESTYSSRAVHIFGWIKEKLKPRDFREGNKLSQLSGSLNFSIKKCIKSFSEEHEISEQTEKVVNSEIESEKVVSSGEIKRQTKKKGRKEASERNFFESKNFTYIKIFSL